MEKDIAGQRVGLDAPDAGQGAHPCLDAPLAAAGPIGQVDADSARERAQ
jgi:hypothetical protein